MWPPVDKKEKKRRELPEPSRNQGLQVVVKLSHQQTSGIIFVLGFLKNVHHFVFNHDFLSISTSGTFSPILLDEQLGWISKEENNAPILRHLRTALPVLRTQPDQAGSHPRFPFVVPWHGWQAYPTCSLVHPQFWRHGGVKMNPSMRRWHVTCSSKILLMFRLVFFRKSGWMLDFLNTSVDIYI